MPGAERVSTLLTEAAPLADLLSLHEHADEDTWTLMADEETVYFAEYDAARQALVIWGDAGQPQPGTEQAWYGRMLHYNSQWLQTGGLTLALDEPGGQVLLSWPAPVAELNPAALSTILTNFAGALRTWRSMVARGASDADGMPANAPAEESGSISFIRV